MKTIFALVLFGFALVASTPLVFDPTYRAPFLIQFYFDIAAKTSNKNLIVSPASVMTSMGLAYLGAGGKTAEEFHETLNFGGTTQSEIAKSYGDVVSNINAESNNFLEFKMANRIYVDQNYAIAPAYNELASQYFGAVAENVDFKAKTLASQKINSWVAAETHDRIKEIVDAESFDEATAAVLINAVYFKGVWKHAFLVPYTAKQDFHLSKNETIQVDMMHNTGEYEVADWTDIDATAIRIPYRNSDIYMLIILPNEIDGLAAMEAKFKLANHAYLQTTPKPEAVRLTLPKFKFEFDTSLIEVLSEMGLQSMFTNTADFSNMVTGDDPVKISAVKHKTFISVDELGTEAAAVTAFVTNKVSGYPAGPRVRTITVDHPFMFAIRDQGMVYFAGHVVNF